MGHLVKVVGFWLTAITCGGLSAWFFYNWGSDRATTDGAMGALIIIVIFAGLLGGAIGASFYAGITNPTVQEDFRNHRENINS